MVAVLGDRVWDQMGYATVTSLAMLLVTAVLIFKTLVAIQVSANVNNYM